MYFCTSSFKVALWRCFLIQPLLNSSLHHTSIMAFTIKMFECWRLERLPVFSSERKPCVGGLVSCNYCHQAGNIQHLPHSHIDQMDHTLLQPIAILILINISFYLAVMCETSPYPSRNKEEKPWMLITCQSLWFLWSIGGNKGVALTPVTSKCRLVHYKKSKVVLHFLEG